VRPFPYDILSTTPIRILLAEDDRAMRQLIATTLRRDRYSVVEVGDGHELLAAVAPAFATGTDGVDLVITDVRLPGRSGLEALAALRAHDWSTPVIVITAFGDAALHEEANRLGADVVLDKPFDLDDLRAAVLALAPCV
jgi:DNA-binding response OmpR family regulator